MKALIFVLCIVSLLTSCSTKQTYTDSDKAEKMQLLGGYTSYRALDKEEKALFATTYKGEMKLKPMKVATQVVAGTNYSFLCNDNDGNTYVVVIYEPLPGQGAPSVTSVAKK